ncbi:MAG: phage portal protein [Alphaproteobacteria bacterium]
MMSDLRSTVARGLMAAAVRMFGGSKNSSLIGLLGGGSLTSSGISVTPDSALRQATVGACVRLLSETIASLPVYLYVHRNDGGKDKVRDHALHDILHNRPNGWLSPFEYLEGSSVNLLTRGNSYSWIERNPRGQLLNLIPLDPDGVDIERADDYGPAYEVTMPDGERLKVSRKELHHVRGPLPKDYKGQSIVTLFREAIASTLGGEQFIASLWKNGVMPSGALKTQGELSDKAINRLRKQFSERYGGAANTGKPLVLEEGMDWVKLSLNPVDAQFIDVMRLRRSEIAAIWRVPPHLVGDLERATFSNIEQMSLEFVIYSLRPWLKRIEQAMNRDLLTEAERRQGLHLKFNVDALLRGDFKSRMDGYATGRQWGWLSRNEVRTMENMNPIADGDDYLTPLNMTVGQQIDEMLKSRGASPDTAQAVLEKLRTQD